MVRWKRPYADPIRVVTGTIAMAGTVFFTFLTVTMVASWPAGSLTGVVVVVVFASVSLTFAWRLHRTALLISGRGVRVRWLLVTRTVSWHDVREFRNQPEGPTTRMVIGLSNGTIVRTPLQRVRRRRSGAVINDGGTWLLREPYDHLLAELQFRLMSQRPPQRPDSGPRQLGWSGDYS